MLWLLLSASAVLADEQNDRRVLMGLKLFPALVAADQDLEQKRTEEGQLPIVLLYREDAVAASNAARRLATQRIKNLPLQITTLPYARLAALNSKPPAALFLVEWSPDELAKVVRFGIAHQRIVFSPFKGDVSAGASAGIFISDRMLPLLNLKTLDAAGIRLHPFLLDVAKTHE
ncbi:MAG TPA: hypothetical protein VGE50_03185 [Gammaproteobacteria bacterium]